MDIGTILVGLSGVLVLAILGWQAWAGILDERSGRGTVVAALATRPDLRPLPRPRRPHHDGTRWAA